MKIPVASRNTASSPDSLLGEIPSMQDEPLEMLVACHGRVRAFTETLKRLAQHLQQKGADREAGIAAGNILRYFDVAAPKHHQDEENDLFPLLLAQSPDDHQLAVLVAQLHADHLMMGELWLRLREKLLLIKDGNYADLADNELAQHFADMYQQHAAREEETVFRTAAQRLDAAQLAQLGRSMSARRRDA
ncbi:MAG: hemerythrin domain-containing protein [Chitinivorax sp.]